MAAHRSRASLVVDSIQTVFLPGLESAPGSVSQVRECGGAPDDAGQGARHRHLPGRPRHQGGRARRARACSSTWSTPCSTSRASSTTPTASCAPSRTASAPPTRSASSRWPSGGLDRGAEPVRLLPRRAPRGRAGLGDRRPASRARGRSCSSSRRSSRRPASARRVAPCSARTTIAYACCWRCWRSAWASRCRSRTSSSTWPGRRACPSPRPIWDVVIAAASSYLDRPAARATWW